MKRIIGLKELREHMETYVDKVKSGSTFIVVRRSSPIFKISPAIDESELWERVVDFTKIQKGGVQLEKILARL